MIPPSSPQIPSHLPSPPSRRVGAILAAAMLAVGIALGILIGPGQASSFAQGARTAALGRVLALLALGGATGTGSEPLLAAGAAGPPAASPQPTPVASSGAAGGVRGAGTTHTAPATTPQASAPGGPTLSSAPSTSHSPSTLSLTPGAHNRTTGSANSTTGSGHGTPTPLPPIAHVWLIVLPYGQSFANALGQPTAAPHLDGELIGKGTLLSSYSSLAASELAGAATLLSGQVTAGVSFIAPPPCNAASRPQDAAGGTQGAAATPCPSGEPAAIQTADSFAGQAVAQITTTAAYREGGLIAITFAPAGEAPGNPSPSDSPPPSTNAPAGAYPPGTLTAALTAAGPPAGALLLSPFLSHAGTRSSRTFNPISPRQSLEGLLRTADRPSPTR